jgi:hypothetical protein
MNHIPKAGSKSGIAQNAIRCTRLTCIPFPGDCARRVITLCMLMTMTDIVMDNRTVVVDGDVMCKSCANGSYYQVLPS